MLQGSFQLVNKNCLNHSSSKQLFSFPKDRRFRESPILTSQTDFVKLSSSFSEDRNKGVSFTRSKKRLIFQNQEEFKDHPPPNLYEPKKDINAGISIAIRLKNIYNKMSEKNPGPGSYSSASLERPSSNCKSVSFVKQKRVLKYPIENQKGSDTPGPYLVRTDRLKNILSNYNNPKQTKIGKLSSRVELASLKLKIKAQQNVLSGRRPTDSIKNLHKQQLPSTFKNSILFKKEKIAVFDKQKRKSIFDVKNENPSPVNYSKFSEFAKRNKPDNAQSMRGSLKFRIKTQVSQTKNVRAKTLPKVS